MSKPLSPSVDPMSDDNAWSDDHDAARGLAGKDARTPKRSAADCRKAPGLMLGANEGQVDDFLDLVDRWEEITGHSLVPESATQASEQAVDQAEESSAKTSAPDPALRADDAYGMLNRIATDFSAQQMRQLGASLIRLADSIDQEWSPDQAKLSYHWLTKAGQIERNAVELAKVAVQARLAASRRTRHLPAEFLGEPAWEMLLELFIQFAGGAKVSTKSLCIASGLPDTTALRLIDRLEEAGLIERSQSQIDKRVTMVFLTRQAVKAVGSILMEMRR